MISGGDFCSSVRTCVNDDKGAVKTGFFWWMFDTTDTGSGFLIFSTGGNSFWGGDMTGVASTGFST